MLLTWRKWMLAIGALSSWGRKQYTHNTNAPNTKEPQNHQNVIALYIYRDCSITSAFPYTWHSHSHIHVYKEHDLQHIQNQIVQNGIKHRPKANRNITQSNYGNNERPHRRVSSHLILPMLPFLGSGDFLFLYLQTCFMGIFLPHLQWSGRPGRHFREALLFSIGLNKGSLIVSIRRWGVATTVTASLFDTSGGRILHWERRSYQTAIYYISLRKCSKFPIMKMTMTSFFIVCIVAVGGHAYIGIGAKGVHCRHHKRTKSQRKLVWQRDKHWGVTMNETMASVCAPL